MNPNMIIKAPVLCPSLELLPLVLGTTPGEAEAEVLVMEHCRVLGFSAYGI